MACKWYPTRPDRKSDGQHPDPLIPLPGSDLFLRQKVKLKMRPPSELARRRMRAVPSADQLVKLVEDGSRVIKAPAGQGRSLPAAAKIRLAVATVPREDARVESHQFRQGQYWPAAARGLAAGRVQAACKPPELSSIDLARRAAECKPPCTCIECTWHICSKKVLRSHSPHMLPDVACATGGR